MSEINKRSGISSIRVGQKLLSVEACTHFYSIPKSTLCSLKIVANIESKVGFETRCTHQMHTTSKCTYIVRLLQLRGVRTKFIRAVSPLYALLVLYSWVLLSMTMVDGPRR